VSGCWDDHIREESVLNLLVCGETRSVMPELQNEDRDNCPVILMVLLLRLYSYISKVCLVVCYHCFCVVDFVVVAAAVAVLLLLAYYYLLFSLALQPSAGYGLMWLCSLARAMASCVSAAQCGLWPPRHMRFLDHTHDAPQLVGLL
jgi:hypothetical protein